MTLPITYADSQTVHATSDPVGGGGVDSWTSVINALTAFISPPGATLVAGFTTTVTSGSTLTLTVTSTTMQVLTGSTAQLVTLPTTSVVAGAAWIISNQSSATATVQSSGANTVITIPAGGTAVFNAQTATPTTAAGWAYQVTDGFLPFATTATAAGTTTLTVTSPPIQVFTGSTTQTVKLPTTGVPAGAQWQIINQSTGAVTVQSSAANTICVLPGVSAAPYNSATLTAVVATPTTAANWNSGGSLIPAGVTLTNPTVTGYTESVVAIGTVTSSNTLSLASGTVQTATLTASTACTFTMPAAVAGESFVLYLKQAASTGLGTATFTSVKWPGGVAPTVTPTAAKMDIFTFVSDGTNWYGTYVQGY
jgi:hypothetical protein